MQSKALIIRLIQQDMKHHQLISNLESIGLATDGVYYLELMEIIADLMALPKSKIEDAFYRIYLDFMNKASNYPVTSKGEELNPLADQCYAQLHDLQD